MVGDGNAAPTACLRFHLRYHTQQELLIALGHM